MLQKPVLVEGYLDRGMELPIPEWLREIAVRAGFHRPFEGFFIRMCREVDNRDMVQPGNFLCGGNPVFFTLNPDIHQDQVGTGFSGHFYCILGRRNRINNNISHRLEGVLDRHCNNGFIFHNQNPFIRHRVHQILRSFEPMRVQPVLPGNASEKMCPYQTGL